MCFKRQLETVFATKGRREVIRGGGKRGGWEVRKGKNKKKNKMLAATVVRPHRRPLLQSNAAIGCLVEDSKWCGARPQPCHKAPARFVLRSLSGVYCMLYLPTGSFARCSAGALWTTFVNRTASGAYAERFLVCCFARAVPEAVRTASCVAPWVVTVVFRHFTACFYQLYCRVAGGAGDIIRDFLELLVPHSTHRRTVKNTVPLFQPQLLLLL